MTRIDDLNRELRVLEDNLVKLKYIGARSIIFAVAIIVLMPFYFFGWVWPNVLGSGIGIFSMWVGYTVKKERKQTAESVNNVQSKLK